MVLSRFSRVRGVLLVGVLVGSLLSLVGVSGAANTAVEGGLDDDGERLFADESRYGSAIKLAQAYLNTEAGGFGADVVVVSGESLVDAIGGVGLAAARQAPVLLTPSAGLTRSVARFIGGDDEDAGFDAVTIVGGTSAVSADVEAALEEFPDVGEVDRVDGEDRYESAVAAAEAAVEETGDPGSWCGIEGPSAFLVSGESLVDGVMVAPLAFRRQMPVLLTHADELPSSVVGFVEDLEVEHVVVVGSEAEVSDDVLYELEDLSIGTTRVDGADAAARSVALVGEAKKCSADELPLVENTFALVSADTPIDGVAAAGALAHGLGLPGSGDALVPVLMVGDDGVLPDAVADFLAGIPVLVGPAYQNVTLVALGGTARITPRLMGAALAAATTRDPLTATIAAAPGSSVVRVRFSSPVNAEEAGSRSNYKVAGTPLFGSDTVVYDRGTQTTTITFDHQLAEGDVVEVVGGKISGKGVGVRKDLRKVAATRLALGPVSNDRIRPRLRILATEGSTAVRVLLVEANPGTDPTDGLFRTDGTISNDEVRIVLDHESRNPTVIQRAGGNDYVIAAFALPNNAGWDISWGCDGATTVSKCTGEINGEVRPLTVRDKVEIVAGAVVDANDNLSRRHVKVASANSDAPRLVRATLTPVTAKLGTANQPLNASVKFGDDGHDATADPGKGDRKLWFTITARTDGAFSGSLGNGWRLTVEEDFIEDPDTVAVLYDERRKHITLTVDGEASVADMVNALRADAGFAANFVVTPEATEEADYTEPAGTPQEADPDPAKMDDFDRTVEFSGGASVATLTLTFNDVLKVFDSSKFNDGQAEDGPFREAADAIEAAYSTPVQTDPPTDPLPDALTDVVTITYTYFGSNVPDADSRFNLPAGTVTNYNDADEKNQNKEDNRNRPRAPR